MLPLASVKYPSTDIWLNTVSFRTSALRCRQMMDKEVARQLRDDFEGTGLLEQVGRVRHDAQLHAWSHMSPRLLVEVYDDFVASANDQQCWSADARQRVSRQ